jgi:Protein of unknown function (DUF1360)
VSARPRGPGLEETIVIALAAARVARAISVDEITEPLRNRLDHWAASERSGDQQARDRLAEFMRCPVCVGWWTSLAISLAWPGQMRLRRGIAAAGAQVLMTLAERLISEQGRAAIHRADVAHKHSQAAA